MLQDSLVTQAGSCSNGRESCLCLAGNFVLTNDPEDPHLAVANGLNQRFLA